MSLTQHRTQLFLDDERYQWLKQKAFTENKSLAQVVREIVDKTRKKTPKIEAAKRKNTYQGLLKLLGTGKKGPADVSTNHDKYLGEALYQEVLRERK